MASVSFARVAGTSTTYEATNAYTAQAVPTATGSSGGGLTGQEVSDYFILTVFTKPYLDAHTLSYPSWRYSYYLWFVLIFLFIVWTVMHQLHWKMGALGALARKLGMRKLTFGTRTTKPAAGSIDSEAGRKKVRSKAPWSTITFAQAFGLAILLAFTFVMCYVGPDYIQPRECMFGGECAYHPVNGDNATNQYGKRMLARALGEAVEGAHRFGKRRLARYGWSPLTDPLLSGPNYTIDKNYWVSSSRIGLIAYALLPLSVALALKQWPMNIFATPFFTNLSVDKTAFWHKWMGRLIWVLSTVHTGLWTKQLFMDLNPFNEPTFYTSWKWHRLMAGGVAYGFLTAMVAFSFKPLRTRYYELFYYSHVALVLGFLVAIIIHYQALQGWCLLAACLWGLERLTRFVVFCYLNYGRSLPVFGEGRIGKAQYSSQGAKAAGFKVHHVEKRLSAEAPKHTATAPYGGEEWSAASASTHNLHDTQAPAQHVKRPVYAYGPGNDDVPDVSHQLPYGAGPYNSREEAVAGRYGIPAPSYPNDAINGRAGLYTTHRIQSIPKGYALAQILPGKVLKLTLRTPRHLSWKPGQHVQLTVPSIRWWQSHPYTIANSQDFTEKVSGARAAGEGDGASELVLLISVRRGFTKALYNSIVDKRKRLVSSATSGTTNAGGVLIRAQTYLPTGSASRVHWDDHSTAVIIVAGTGVTYGLAVLEQLCLNMAAKDAALRGEMPTWAKKKNRKSRPTQLTRVRFVWILREYAHLAWIAPALRRCLDISDPARLRIDLFVTRQAAISSGPQTPFYPYSTDALATPSKEDLFRPPAPRFARHVHERSNSMDSDISNSSRTFVEGSDYPYSMSGIHSPTNPYNTRGGDVATPGEDGDFSVTDMILFDGEDDEPTAADEEISRTIRKEGKIRRALSRKKKALSGSEPLKPAGQPYGHASNRLRPGEESDMSGDERPTPPRKNSTAQQPLSSSHAYPPTLSSSRRGSNFSYTHHLDDGKEFDALSAGSGFNTPFGRRGSHLPLLGEEEAGGFDMDALDREDLHAMAELARGGKPDLPNILDAEIERSQGRIIVAVCGPPALNNLVRNMVAKRISPARVAKGDLRGSIELVVEDFTS